MIKKSSRDDYDISLYQSPTYISWNNMKNRCLHKSNPKYDNYGGRGIGFCPEWNKFSGFLKDMGIRPKGMTLDRINGSKGYFKGNCRWASTSLQSSNRRSSTNTGEKYISLWGNGYIVTVNPFRHRSFKSIEEAIKQRDLRVVFRDNNIKFKENSMIPEKIKVTKRITNKDYEYEEVTMEVILEKGESVEEVIAEIKEIIVKGLSTEKAAIQKNKNPKPKKEEAAVEKEEEEEKPKGKKRSKGASPYDRTDETHKKLFTETLDKELPGWRTKSPKKAKEASSILAGEEFLDNDGDVIPEFTQKLIKLME